MKSRVCCWGSFNIKQTRTSISESSLEWRITNIESAFEWNISVLTQPSDEVYLYGGESFFVGIESPVYPFSNLEQFNVSLHLPILFLFKLDRLSGPERLLKRSRKSRAIFLRSERKKTPAYSRTVSYRKWICMTSQLPRLSYIERIGQRGCASPRQQLGISTRLWSNSMFSHTLIGSLTGKGGPLRSWGRGIGLAAKSCNRSSYSTTVSWRRETDALL